MKDLKSFQPLVSYLSDNDAFKILNNDFVCEVYNKKPSNNANEGVKAH